MNRREFTKTATAALWLPSLLIPRQQVKQIDLSLFCDDEDCQLSRYDLSKPFHQEELTYATDGRVCVRTGLSVRMGDSPEEMRLPKAAGLTWWDHDSRGRWRSWNRMTLVPSNSRYGNQCPKCFGKGRVGNFTKHATCDGTSFVTVEEDDGFSNYEKPCHGCRTGYVGGSECPRCEGRGYINFDADLGGVLICPSYHAKVATLGNVEYCLPDDPAHPVRFRADGVDGLLMPLAKD